MSDLTYKRLVPVGEAAVHFGLTREQTIRRVQRGALVGRLFHGRWYVDANELKRPVARTRLSRRADRSATHAAGPRAGSTLSPGLSDAANQND